MDFHGQSSHDLVSHDQPMIIQLPNCSSDNIISIDKLTSKKNEITRKTSLKNVFSMYQEKNYNEVIDVLMPILKQETGSQSLFFVTLVEGNTPPNDAQPSAQLLLESLININRMNDAFMYGVQCLLEVLSHYAVHGASDSFISALAFHCRILTKCLDADISILSQSEYKVVQNFIICLIKILDLLQESVDTFTLPDDVYIVPWKLLYNVLSCDSLPNDGLVRNDKLPIINEVELPKTDNEMEQDIGLSDGNTGAGTTPMEEQGSHDSATVVEPSQPEPMDTSDPPTTTLDHPPVTSSPDHTVSLPPSTSSGCSSPHRPHPDNQDATPSPLLSFPSSTNVSVISTRDSPMKSSRTVSPLFDINDRKETSLRFLQQAHSLLGSLCWCSKDKGSFLIFFLSILHKELKELTALSKELREVLLVELEQCYYCLYGYPYKKAKLRGLVEHNADQIPISWERAVLLLQYFHPSYLPAVDESKSPQVTNELITLYKKIVNVVPSDEAVMSKSSLSEYINGILTSLPHHEPHPYSSLIGEIYYLLADDYLRLLDNLNAVKHYQSSILYRPHSFDTWAGLAIGLSQRITEDKINQCDPKKVITIEKFIERKTPLAIRCFTKAMELNSSSCYLVEKFGFFLYAVHSFMTQIMQQPLLYTSKSIRDWAKLSMKDMLILADKQFDLALTLTGSKHYEPWLYHFMLGKISMKLKRQPQTVLQHFLKATDILHSEGATYPALVEIITKGHAIQAIEVHYHFLSIFLKFLLSTDGHDESIFSGVITTIRNYPLGRITYESVWNWAVNIVKKYKKIDDNQQMIEEHMEDVKSTEEKDKSSDVKADTQSHDSRIMPPPVMPLSSCDDHVIPKPPSLFSSQTFPDFSQLTESDFNWQSQTDKDIPIEDDRMMKEQSDDNGGGLYSSPMEQSDEGQLILVDDDSSYCSSSSSNPNNTNDASAIELVAQNLHQVSKPDSLSRFSIPIPDPLTEAVYGVAMCAVRFPAYFKPLYRLASTLHAMGYPHEAKMFLLGPIPSCFMEIQDKLVPIFALRSNIYQNMWQIQIPEINRPGNFATHARRCLELLIDVLRDTSDLSSLVYITQQLKARVDPSKQYMRESVRQSMYIRSLIVCVEMLKIMNSSINLSDSDSPGIVKMLIDAYSTRNMVSKSNELKTKEDLIKDIELFMMKCFTSHWNNNPPDEMSFSDKTISFDACLKFCQMKVKQL